MTWKPTITEIKVPNMNRIVKVAQRDIKSMTKSGKIFNTKAGQIAEFDSQLVQTWEYWEYITDTIYPIYKNGMYVGTSVDN